MPRILISDVFTIANIGSAALLENTLLQLRKTIPDASFEILAQDAESIRDFCGENTVTELFVLPVLEPLPKKLAWLINNLSWMTLNAIALIISKLGLGYHPFLYTFSKQKKAVVKAYRNSDIVVSIGAERVNDNYYKGLLFALYGYWFAKMLKKPVVLYCQTIGPLYRPFSRLATRYVLNKVDLILLRDLESKEVLEDIKISNKHVEVVADVVTTQQPVESKAISEILIKEQIERSKPSIGISKPLIGISAIKWIYPKSNDPCAAHNKYIQALAKVADYLAKEKNATVVFVATNFDEHGSKFSDVAVAQEIVDKMQFRGSAKIIEKLYSPREFQGILKEMDFFIATRMHACIFATTANVPTIAINYQFKSYGYMNLLGLERFTCDIEDVNFQKIKTLIDEAWPIKNQIKNQLGANMKKLIKKIDKANALVANLVYSNASENQKIHSRL